MCFRWEKNVAFITKNVMEAIVKIFESDRNCGIKTEFEFKFKHF